MAKAKYTRNEILQFRKAWDRELLEKVRAEVNEILDELDFVVSEYVESTLASNYLNDALSGARERLAALSPTPNEP